MGYSVQKFVSKLDANLICGICANVLEEAVITPCGHSFCRTCVETWLESSETDTCPSCRATTLIFDLIPVLALRGIVGNLHTSCENPGCSMVITVDQVASHSQECEYALTKCSGCGEQVKRCDLCEHHATCKRMRKRAKTELRNGQPAHLTIIDELTKTISMLEMDLKRTKDALRVSKDEVQSVEKELRDIRNDFISREADEDSSDDDDPDWDSDYNYGYSPQSISQLTRWVVRHLLEKPCYVDRDRIFTSIKRCYDFYHNYPGYTQDVHMLIATCFASNWFSEHQRKYFERWLTSIVRPICLR